jgi:hypothetical protein
MQCILYEFISLEHNNTIQYNTDILFPIKEPFPVEQLTKNLIQWFMDWLHNCRRHVSDVCTSDFGHVGHAM